MHVDVSERTEQAIRVAMQSGRFSTAEAFLEAAATAFFEKAGPVEGANKPTGEELIARFKKYRGTLDMTREELTAARHQGLP